jgi:hypothetical protein
MHPIWQHAGEGGIITTLLGVLARFGWRTIQHDRSLLKGIHKELTLQRTNCLQTIQAQGHEQVEILKTIDRNITEQSGYIKGWLEGQR